MRTKFTREQIDRVKELISAGLGIADIVSITKIGRGTVFKIKTGYYDPDKQRKKEIKEGFFNPNEKENWLTG